MVVTNVIVYKEAWAENLQAELDEPNKWREICNVEYTNDYVLHNPYLTDMTVQTHSRGTPYTLQVHTETDESTTISTSKIAAQFIDRGDLAQSGYAKQMTFAERQAVLLNEAIESAVLGCYTQGTDFGTENLSGSAGSSQITVSITNIDDIIRNVKRTIRVANGETLMARNGVFIVWRPADFEILESYMGANGFTTQDKALGQGAVPGLEYMGVTHYSSNLLTANHVLGGVKKVIHLGICKGTYGQIMVDEKDPYLYSGISVVSRVDYAVKVWTKTAGVVFDINVA
jgi:hypothetical protein